MSGDVLIDPSATAPPPPENEVPWLLAPVGGTPPVVVDEAALQAAIAAFAAADGPVAVDAERASGYRYSNRAYLVQLRRAGAGSALIDPTGVPDLSALGAALAGAEWVIHAASQDLACLAEIGLHPVRLFDTELAGRLLGHPRVALGTLVEQLLGVRLEKGHSAADWSTRPLPQSWLDYAALDVELLVELRDVLAADLEEQGKQEWAQQEFAATLAAARRPVVPRAEPWRRLSGIHALRQPRQLAAARALWEARDAQARARDIAPGRILPDKAIVNAVASGASDAAALLALPVFGGPRMRRGVRVWLGALTAAAALPERELPRMVAPAEADTPPANRWAERDPVAAARLVRVRAALGTLASANRLPVENLLEPAVARRLAWDPPADVGAALEEAGARPWQIALVEAAVAAALVEAPAVLGGATGVPAQAEVTAPGEPGPPQPGPPEVGAAGVRLVPVGTELAAAAAAVLGLPPAGPAGPGGAAPDPGSGLVWPAGTGAAPGFPRAEDLYGLAYGAEGFLVVLAGQVIGTCGPKGPPAGGRQEIGYGLAGGFRGRGLGTAAVRLLLAELAARPGIATITAEVALANDPSLRLLQRLGFEPAAEPGPQPGHQWWSRPVVAPAGS